MKIIKKDGLIELWDSNKILEAIKKASLRCEANITKEQALNVADKVKENIFNEPEVKTKDLHALVINELNKQGFTDIAKSYQEYRDYKNSYAKSWEDLKATTDDILFLGDRENANFDSSLISTKGALIKGALAKELYKQFYLSNTEKALIKRGDIYIHDLRDLLFGSINCCLFDMGNVLKGGFEMSNTKYSEPKSVLTALQVIGDVTMVASANQFGGFTVPEVDKILLPYVFKSLDTWTKFFTKDCGITDKNQVKKLVDEKVKEELRQGFQSYELKLNTLPSSRGDYPFTTITFMQWDTNLDTKSKYWLAEIDKIILRTRYEGHGGKPALFPKLVALFDENQYKEDKYTQEVFDECILCSSKCMYPDMLSLTGSPKSNKVAQEYNKHHTIISPMGCRAYLSHWGDKDNPSVTVGRCNIGAVSLNIPLIMAVAKKEYGDLWREHFYGLLEYRLQVIRKFLQKRYDIIRHTKCGTNPMAFCQGGFYKGYKEPDEEIGDLVNYMTASFGYIGLNEASILWHGKTLVEDNSVAINILKFIQDKLEEFKKEDGYLYAIYGTPAESYQSTAAKAYKDFTGDTQFGTYFTNSFHCHVSENITPFTKQDKEADCFHLSNGGHISYGRVDNPTNLEAIKALYLRAMDLGYYYAVNFDAIFCQDCGRESYNVTKDKCPYCESKNRIIINRVCGYLGYSDINGTSRFNDGLLANLKDRRSM